MPYTSFKKTKGGIRVSKAGGGGFTAHTSSMVEAHKTAGMRELAKHGKLRVANKRTSSNASSRSSRSSPGASMLGMR